MLRSHLTACYLQVLDAKRRIPFSAIFKEALLNPTKPRGLLEADQLNGLKRIIRHAMANVEAYRDATSEKTVSSARHVIELLDQLPLLSKAQLLAGPVAHQSVEQLGPRFVGSTSGSTGHSLVFHFDSRHAAWSEACKWRGRHWWGGRRGDRALVLWGRPIVEGQTRRAVQGVKSWLRNEAHFDTFESLSNEFLRNIVRHVNLSRPTYVYGYGSSLAALALYMKRNGTSLNHSRAPMFVQFTADHMSDYEKEIAMEAFAAPVISDYGASEIPGIALQCRKGRLHVSMDACIVEVLSHQGERIEDGSPGEIVVTALHNHAMPLIRYKIGDIGRLIPEPCSCGNNMPIIELIAGKAIDLITTSHVSNVSAHYLDYINIKLMRGGHTAIAQFQFVQNDYDSFELLVVPTGLGDMQYSSSMFANEIAAKLGPVAIDVIVVDNIPAELSGKRRYFVNRMGRKNSAHELSQTSSGIN